PSPAWTASSSVVISHISDGLNRNLSETDTTTTSTSPCRSYCTLNAAVSPPKFPPSTSTFLRIFAHSLKSQVDDPGPALRAIWTVGQRALSGAGFRRWESALGSSC